MGKRRNLKKGRFLSLCLPFAEHLFDSTAFLDHVFLQPPLRPPTLWLIPWAMVSGNGIRAWSFWAG